MKWPNRFISIIGLFEGNSVVKSSLNREFLNQHLDTRLCIVRELLEAISKNSKNSKWFWQLSEDSKKTLRTPSRFHRRKRKNSEEISKQIPTSILIDICSISRSFPTRILLLTSNQVTYITVYHEYERTMWLDNII